MYKMLVKVYIIGTIRLKGSDYMSITSTELKNHLSYYLTLSAKEDILITKNGKVIAKLTNPMQDRVDRARGLFGIIAGASNEVKGDRLKRQ